MILLADDDLACRCLHLGMAFQAKVVIPFDQQLLIDRAMRVMTSRAAFAHRFVFECERPGLVAMALGAGLIELGHRQSARRFLDVAPVRVVAIDTVHPFFHDGMMMRQIELRMNFQMALITARGVLARIYDEFASATSASDVLAARAVTGFTPRHARPFQIVFVKPAMGTGGENPGDVRVAIRASLVPDEYRAFDIRRRDHGAVHCGTRAENQAGETEGSQSYRRAQTLCVFGFRVRDRFHRFAEFRRGCGGLIRRARESMPRMQRVP